jgi:hypothetical protein
MSRTSRIDSRMRCPRNHAVFILQRSIRWIWWIDIRARARECLERAEKTCDSDAKRAFELAAEFWLGLADQADNLQAKK